MKSISPYLTFNGHTEEAFTFYQSVFGGEPQIDRYKDLEDNMGATGDDLDKVANVELEIAANLKLYASDLIASSGQKLIEGNNFSIHIETESEDETESLFTKLSSNGTVTMPLMETKWAKQFGMCTDKFGINWMVYFPGDHESQPS